QQQDKYRPALGTEKVGCDQENHSHGPVPDCGFVDVPLVTSTKSSSSERRNGLTLTISPPNSHTRCRVTRWADAGMENVTKPSLTTAPENACAAIPRATISVGSPHPSSSEVRPRRRTRPRSSTAMQPQTSSTSASR